MSAALRRVAGASQSTSVCAMNDQTLGNQSLTVDEYYVPTREPLAIIYEKRDEMCKIVQATEA